MTVAKHGNGQHPSVVYQSSKEWNIGPTSLCFAQLTCCRFSIVVITPILDFAQWGAAYLVKMKQGGKERNFN